MRMLLQLLLEILRNRPIINLILSLLTGGAATATTVQPQRVSNTEMWEIVRSPEGRIENIVIHRNVVVNGAENTYTAAEPVRRVLELD
jgi:predicted metal-dependent TIM-barrel fold hydrolase